MERVRVPGSIVHISQQRQITNVHAHMSEELMKNVTIRAEQIRMCVNSLKTQLLCVSAATGSSIQACMKCGNQKITSGKELKILGFKFGNTPSVKPHVEYMLEKARKKLWIIRHIKKSGVKESDLLKIYNSCLL